MSTLQFEEISNDTSITEHNDSRLDSQLNRLSLSQNKALMKMARNRAWRMSIMHQTPFAKELPKALKEVLSKLSAEFRKRKAAHAGKVGAQIKPKMVEISHTSCNSEEAEKSAALQAELSPEIKFILQFRRDVTVDQALIKQRVLKELKERRAKGNTESKQSNDLPKRETAEIKLECSNNDNISQECNNYEGIEKDVSEEK